LISDIAFADGMQPEENSGEGRVIPIETPSADPICASEMQSEENSGEPVASSGPHGTSLADLLPAPERMTPSRAHARRQSEAAIVEGHRRASLLMAFDAFREADPGISYATAARMLGCETIYLWRLARRRDAGESLAPQWHKAGRRRRYPDLSELLQMEVVRTKLDMLYVSTIGASSQAAAAGRRTGKLSVALQRFAEEPECPGPLADRLRLGYQPRELVSYLRRITPEMEARYRGEKNFKLNGIVSRRDDTVRLPDGRRAEIPPGYLVELDDMSSNQPFFVDLPDGSSLLSRQGLYARDVKSGRWLGFELIARPREAYRAEDILRFLRRLMLQYGKFSVLRLERGIWKARSIVGWDVGEAGAQDDSFERPAMDDGEKASLCAGLEDIGIRIQHAKSAHEKGGIESGFNYLQTILATYTTDLVNVGRYAGEFELAAKRVRQARAGRHPGELCFAPIDYLAEAITKAMAYVNKRPRARDAANTADAEWERGLTARPLPVLTERDFAAFLPEMRERAIDGGRIELTVNGQKHDFRSEMFAQLGHGYRVFVRFDPAEPTLGAAIYNRETSSANHLGLAQGELICLARWEMPGPQLEVESAPGLVARAPEEIYGVSEDDGYAARKRQERFVRTAFRALPRPGQPAVKVAEARDSHGQVVRAQSAADAAAPTAALPQLSPRRPRAGLLPPPPTKDAFARRQARLAEDAEAARALREMEPT
jgi:hypothetical protein